MVSNHWRDDTEIIIGGTAVEEVDDFCYLGSFASSNSNHDKDCQVRIGKANTNSMFGRLKPVWKNNNISLALKIQLCESWLGQHCFTVGLCHKKELGSSTS